MPHQAATAVVFGVVHNAALASALAGIVPRQQAHHPDCPIGGERILKRLLLIPVALASVTACTGSPTTSATPQAPNATALDRALHTKSGEYLVNLHGYAYCDNDPTDEPLDYAHLGYHRCTGADIWAYAKAHSTQCTTLPCWVLDEREYSG